MTGLTKISSASKKSHSDDIAYGLVDKGLGNLLNETDRSATICPAT